MKKQTIKAGALIQIPLGANSFGYGQIINKSEIAFFDYMGKKLSASELQNLSRKILFVIAVMNSAIKSGRWEIVDAAAIPDELNRTREYFIQDIVSNEVSIYRNTDGSIRPSKRAEAQGLECAAVWEAEHVEDRLRDHFSGKPNVWLENMRLK